MSKEERAVRVLALLEAEKLSKAKALKDILQFAHKDAGVLEGYDLAGAVQEVRQKNMQVKDLRGYRNGVKRLGVIVK